MKTLILILFLCLGVSRGFCVTTTNASDLPVHTAIQNTDRTLMVDPLVAGPVRTFTITLLNEVAQMTAELSTNANFLNSILTNQSFVDSISNIVYNNQTVISNISFTTSSNTVLSLASTVSPVSLLSISNMTLAVSSAGSNTYWLNCGITNSLGQTNIYQAVYATNDVVLGGVTNSINGSLLSTHIFALGANRTIFFPTNVFQSGYAKFITNGLTLASQAETLVLSNGNELRLTFQADKTNAWLWTTFGQ